MIIELIGLPAVGKTTLVSSIVHRKQAQTFDTLFGSESSNRFIRFIKKMLFIVKNIYNLEYETFKLYFAVILETRTTFWRKISLWFNFILLESIYNRFSTSKELIILDQGKLQLAWSIFIENNFRIERSLQKHLREVEVLYISVYVNKEQYLKRFEGRKWKKDVYNRYKNLIYCDDFLQSIDTIIQHTNKSMKVEI